MTLIKSSSTENTCNANVFDIMDLIQRVSRKLKYVSFETAKKERSKLEIELQANSIRSIAVVVSGF